MPTLPSGRLVAVIKTAITTVNGLMAVCGVGLALSVTVTVKLNVPAVVGVPSITPVTASRVRPVGSAPTVMLQVYGVVPPVAANVCAG